MLGDIFNTMLYQPLYNGLVFLISFLPYGGVGVAVILLTIFVKFLILPLTHKSTKAQARLRELEPEVKKVKEKAKDDKQEQAKKVMELYKKHGINPLSGCFLFLIQLPIIIALYWVFWKGLTNGIDESNLYSFIKVPEVIGIKFLGAIDVTGKSFLIAALAGITQYFQMKLSVPQFGDSPKSDNEKKDGKPSMKDDFMKSFKLQMKYGFPFFVFFIAYSISAAVALYWLTSNLFSIIHELLIKKKAIVIMAEGETEKNAKEKPKNIE